MSDSRSMKIVNVPRFVTLTPDVARLKVLGLEATIEKRHVSP